MAVIGTIQIIWIVLLEAMEQLNEKYADDIETLNQLDANILDQLIDNVLQFLLKPSNVEVFQEKLSEQASNYK